MPELQWTIEHAVFVTSIDDQHKEIFDALSSFQAAFASGDEALARSLLERLLDDMVGHFAHEERLMHAARYSGLRWHRGRHNAARRRVAGFVLRLERGDTAAAAELVEYLTTWLHDHTRVADRMMGAALRNHDRTVWKVTITGGTKPRDACRWTTSKGEPMQFPEPEKTL